MAIYVCKICGAPLHIKDGNPIVQCSYCGTEQTPAGMESALSVLLLKNGQNHVEEKDFATARMEFVASLQENPQDYRAWWGLLLCETRNFSVCLTDLRLVCGCFANIVQYAPYAETAAMQEHFDRYLHAVTNITSMQLHAKVPFLAQAAEEQIAQLEARKQQLIEEGRQDAQQHPLPQASGTNEFTAEDAMEIAGGILRVAASLAVSLISPRAGGRMLNDMIYGDEYYDDGFVSPGLSPQMQAYRDRQRARDKQIAAIPELIEDIRYRAKQMGATDSPTLETLTNHIYEQRRAYTFEPSLPPLPSEITTIFNFLSFCPICGYSKDTSCPLCHGTHLISVPNSDKFMTPADFLSLIRDMEDVEEIHHFMMEYLDKQPDSIDPRIVEIVKKQLKIERSYGNAKKDTIRKIMELE